MFFAVVAKKHCCSNFAADCSAPAGNQNRRLVSSSLAVLSAPFLVHCADYVTAPTHRCNAAIAVTNDRNPSSAMLVRKQCFPWRHPSEFCRELEAGRNLTEAAASYFSMQENPCTPLDCTWNGCAPINYIRGAQLFWFCFIVLLRRAQKN